MVSACTVCRIVAVVYVWHSNIFSINYQSFLYTTLTDWYCKYIVLCFLCGRPWIFKCNVYKSQCCWSWHGSGDYWPTSHCGNTGLIPGECTWDLWTNWKLDRFKALYFGISLSDMYTSQQWSVLVEALRYKPKGCGFDSRWVIKI